MGMASNNNRLQPSGHLNVTGQYNNRRSPSPSSSRPVPPDPGSPGPVEETASDYFNPLSQAPSAQSQTSLSPPSRHFHPIKNLRIIHSRRDEDRRSTRLDSLVSASAEIQTGRSIRIIV
ncbi:hypothetical protein LB505_003901 [Fusarium chuoi]|nr:hypothetical protein LB505_003901 [Fusarium chuoi]